MYARTILPSAGRVSLSRNRRNANRFTRIDTVNSTRTSLHNTISFLQRSGRCISHRTAVLEAYHEDMHFRLNNSLDGENNNSKAEWKGDIGRNRNSQPINHAMISNLATPTVLSPLRSSRLDVLSGKRIQSRKNSNRSNGHDRSENKMFVSNDEKDDAKQRGSYGIISRQTEDQIHSILTQAKSTPNIITMMRICSTPALSYFILTQQYTYALTGCILAAISDGLDGYIARNYDGKTVLGTYLDPFADKLVINCLALSLSSVGVLPNWCVGIWMAKDIILFVGAYRAVALSVKGTGHAVLDPAHTTLKIEPTFISKVNTILQFGTIGVGLGMASLDIPSNDIVHVLSGISCGTTVASGLSYLDGKSMTNSGNSMSSRTNNDGRSRRQ